MTAEAFAPSPVPGADDVVLGAFGRIQELLDEVRGVTLWPRSDDAARQGVEAGFALMQRMQSTWLGLLRDLDTRPEAVPRARAGCVGRTFLRERLHRTAAQAANDMSAALALSPDADTQSGGLPTVAEAFAAGQISREHVDLAVRTMRKVPREALSAPMPTGTDVDGVPLAGRKSLEKQPVAEVTGSRRPTLMLRAVGNQPSRVVAAPHQVSVRQQRAVQKQTWIGMLKGASTRIPAQMWALRWAGVRTLRVVRRSRPTVLGVVWAMLRVLSVLPSRRFRGPVVRRWTRTWRTSHASSIR